MIRAENLFAESLVEPSPTLQDLLVQEQRLSRMSLHRVFEKEVEDAGRRVDQRPLVLWARSTLEKPQQPSVSKLTVVSC